MNTEPRPVQVEMPFAMVLGEPLTEMPRDLYIPPQAMEVFLDAFEGPLDLLLYLIRRQNLNILDIPIAEITRQYMQYIERDGGTAAGPRGRVPGDGRDAGRDQVADAAAAGGGSQRDGLEEDPRAELVRRLQEYERFKQAALHIDALPRLERDHLGGHRRVCRPPAWCGCCPRSRCRKCCSPSATWRCGREMFAHHHIQREPLSVRARMSDILATLQAASSFTDFAQLFQAEEGAWA